MKTDIQLIKQAKTGDVHAFARLYETIYQDLYHFALYTLKILPMQRTLSVKPLRMPLFRLAS